MIRCAISSSVRSVVNILVAASASTSDETRINTVDDVELDREDGNVVEVDEEDAEVDVDERDDCRIV